MHTKFGGETDRYGKAFLKQWSFIEAHQLDPEFTAAGSARRPARASSSATAARPSQWKANYHTSRALMNVATMLREVEAKGGRLP